MMPTKRRSILAATASAALARPSRAQSSSARTLRLVPQADLANLDPIWTPAAVTNNHGYTVFDTLYALDERLQVRPQMADGHQVSDDGVTWTIKLRSGLIFHDGEPVRGRDCVASLLRWSKRDGFGQMLARVVDGWEAPDDLTIRIRLKSPFPRLLEALGKRSIFTPFIMPERLAQTEPTRQITEMIGSGPYRFVRDEWSSGNRVVYARHEAYVPRDEPASLLAGGKHAHFDRIEWRIVPDASTATAALLRGEVDWLEQTMPDLNPMMTRNSNVRVEALDQYGTLSFLRFNSLTPPFNNPALRRAVLGAIDQDAYMQAVTGGNIRWQRCASMFPCGVPFSNEVGAPFLRSPPDLAKARDAIAAAGYAGERVVIMSPSDFASIAPLGDITADALAKAGMNIDLQTMDWGTLVQRRASRAPVEAGVWNIFHSWAPATSMMTPAFNDYVRGLGAGGYFGWYENARIEALIGDWLTASTDQQQQAIYDAVQAEAWAAPPTIMLGQYFPTTAYRGDLTGRITTSSPLPWNIRRA
ncbi:ABC transporter substrate-binding protein [Neoroseomonas lacus]|uniref:Substrate-binding protein n=1 Tax=Neoroseomonas lacus TaxID=287609 RepID=A0A917NPV8_9PROT|nr:ABC transporter substrate-binding protein [Neoroseomonas lacus]GGJ17007.1 substrate-binding protein [Neoroseomonas lacus]